MKFRERRWGISESQVTPERLLLSRREFLGRGVGAAGLAAGIGLGAGPAIGAQASGGAALAAEPNPRFRVTDPRTPEAEFTSYNNFYEFGFTKDIVRAAARLKTSPWRIVVDGACDHPFEIDVDDLLKKVALEERICRLRCVEAWSMVVPWVGFPLAELVKMASPKSDAAYLRMETFLDPKMATMQSAPQYPWPYVEGLTIAEATNELAFLAVGAYGRTLEKQNGAPIRLVVPWKYGFKSAKSITRFTFTAKRPVTFWQELGPSEYGFWANVNPEVAHRRWSQARERRVGDDERVPTLMYNGYAEEVAGLYAGLGKEKLFM
ncbi:MAG: protein-methionine-sulfoxide reductase catalytic subunit MsrP [Siculibacillus sp.]|nr:protein-methionine-sulfoxide reductase catalytic subunit MsrP [Siculibacillus sp.]